MSLRDRLQWAARAAEPAGLLAIREALAFGAAHELSTRRRDQVRAFRRARQFGIDLIPDGRRLDGMVVDAGANHGDFAAAMLALEPRATVIAIEPVPATVAVLERRFARDPRVTVVPKAVSDRHGTATMHVTVGDVLASTLRPRDILNAAYDNTARVVDEVEVDTAPLDELVPAGPVRLLKIDVQGAEIPALSGARGTLAKTDAVLLEMNFVSQYEGDAIFTELHHTMVERDFVLAGMGSISTRGDVGLWADACYVPAAATRLPFERRQDQLP